MAVGILESKLSIPVIGLCGYAGAGKDTAADAICELLYFDSIHHSFASKIRNITSNVFGVPYSWFLDREKKDQPISRLGNRTPRELLRAIGEPARTIYPRVWIDPVIQQIQESPGVVHIVRDLRLPEEQQALRENFSSIIIRVDRPGLQIQDHSTERPDLLDPDLVLVNDGSLKDLYNKIQTILSTLQVHLPKEPAALAPLSG